MAKDCFNCKFGETINGETQFQLQGNITINQFAAEGTTRCTNNDDKKTLSFDENGDLICTAFVPKN